MGVLSQNAKAAIEAQDEPVISAASFLHWVNKPRQSKADIQLQPVDEIAIPVVKASITAETLELPKTPKRKDLD